MDSNRTEEVSVCFVCLGNICRSPTAEGVMRRLAEQTSVKLRIDSAGTAAYHVGERADGRSRAAAKARGYELSSLARKFTPEDFEQFDYVLAMDRQNLEDLQQLAEGSHAGRSHLGLLRDFDPTAPVGASVPDPYYGGQRGFEEVLNQCERACGGLLQEIKKRS